MYWVDGVEVSYEHMIEKVLAALEDEIEVSYAFHLGVDCFWIDETHPWFARPVYLEQEGLMVNGQLIEPLEES